ncbi:hypothetical protein K435DRAFT_574622, partial [Dendrothele bispora CBS 962.96]
EKVYGTSYVDHYRFRPEEYENLSLYEWIQTAEMHKIPQPRKKKDPVNEQEEIIEDIVQESSFCNVSDSIDATSNNRKFLRFKDGHPQLSTHEVYCNMRRAKYIVPNFKGGQLPRKDCGDEEYYFCTMLSLFKPWRSGMDLKPFSTTWTQAFTYFKFTETHKKLMRNFNLRYECYDARDNYHAHLKK